jgi:hypothetical protein
MKVRKAVFPAAGLGTRFLPATKAQPKEMLPLVDKPMIDVSDRYQAPVIAVERVPSQRIHQYGVIKARPVESRLHEVLDLVEVTASGHQACPPWSVAALDAAASRSRSARLASACSRRAASTVPVQVVDVVRSMNITRAETKWTCALL